MCRSACHACILFAASAASGDWRASAQSADDPATRSVALVGANIARLADRLDSFFGNERVEEEANRTRLRLIGGLRLSEDDGATFDGDVDIRLSLPRTEDRLNLFFSGGSEEDEDGFPVSDTERDPFGRDRRFDATGVGFRYFFVRRPERAILVQTGLHDVESPDLFVKPRHRASFRAGSWAFDAVQEATWSSDDGFGARALVDVDRRLGERRLFRLTPVVSWAEEKSGVHYGAQASLLEFIDAGRAFDASVAADFRSQPRHRLESAGVRLRYRQTVWRKWLELEAAPALSFPRDRNYRPTAEFRLRLEITFGGEEIALD